MNIARIKRVLAKLEAQVPTVEEQIRAMSDEELDRAIRENIEMQKAWKAEIDAALASGIPKRVAWARRMQREMLPNEEHLAVREELLRKLPDLRALYVEPGWSALRPVTVKQPGNSPDSTAREAMNTAKLMRLLAKLEARYSKADYWRLSIDDRWQRLVDLVRKFKAHRRKIDDALASDNPRRRAWANRWLNQVKCDPMPEGEREHFLRRLQALQAEYAASLPYAIEPLGATP